jgi:hypothetical protein
MAEARKFPKKEFYFDGIRKKFFQHKIEFQARPKGRIDCRYIVCDETIEARIGRFRMNI